MFPSNYARHGDLVRQRIRNCHGDEMKHLDVVDGVIGATSLEARPPSAVIGDNIELLILHLRMPDAETWIAHTATHAVIRIEEQQIQDYLLISNGLMHRTPCVFSIKEETVDRLDDGLLEQLSREGIGLTDSSTMYIATAYVQHSYTELTHCLTFFWWINWREARTMLIILRCDIANLKILAKRELCFRQGSVHDQHVHSWVHVTLVHVYR